MKGVLWCHIGLVVVLFGNGAWAGPGGSARQVSVDRGHLSLAWEAHDEGLCDEALEHLVEIPDGSPLTAEAASLRGECLYDLGRYREAAVFLGSPGARLIPDREALALDVVWDWVWGATAAGAFEEAWEALAAGRLLVGGDPYIEALEGMAVFRSRVVADLAAGRARGRLAGIQPEPPSGEGWIQAAPWDVGVPWVPETTPAEWFPPDRSHLAAVLWLRVDSGAVRDEILLAGERAGLSVQDGGDTVSLASTRGETVTLDVAEWQFRGAVEGLGAKGAARVAVGRAREEIRGRVALVAWAKAHAGPVQITGTAGVLQLTHPDTGRRLALDPALWWDGFDPDGEPWLGFWSDVLTELGRPTRTYRCFCGRDTAVRQVLVRDPGDALVVGQGDGFSVILAVLCSEHVRYVTPELLGEWGVGVEGVLARARSDEEDRPWDLAFHRGELGGAPFLVFHGEGAASLAREPALLLGAVEAVDGKGTGDRPVRVVAPTSSVILVFPDGPGEALDDRRTAAHALRRAWAKGFPAQRLDYRARLRLPTTGRGRFQVRAAP